MRKSLLLPLFVVLGLVSQAWAQEHCKEGGQLAFCQWSGATGGCFTVNNEYEPNIGTPCATLIANCKKDGALYTGASVPSALTQSPYGAGENCGALGLTKAAGGNEACGFDCDWGAGGCWEIKTDVNGDNGAVIATCAEAIANCDKDGVRYSSTGGKCTGSVVGGIQSCNKWCKWPTGCTEIKPDPTGQYGDVFATCAEAEANCTANGELFPSLAACNGNTPIITTGRSIGLTVVPNGNTLYIISGKAATVELFSMNGAKVFSGKVAAGNNSLSLGKQRQGVYYAVVKSDSQKQTVKVVLK